MKTVSTLFVGAAAFATILSSLPAQAHGIWFAQRARQLALIYGVGADDLDAVKRMPSLTSVTGYDGDWKPVVTQLRVAGAIPVVDSEAPVAAVAATMDYGMWSKTPDGEWHNKGRDEVPTAIIAEKTMKYAVHLTQPLTAPVPVLAGHTLQLVPVGTDIPQKKDAPLKVSVLYQGKPIAGADVMSDYVNDPDQVPVKTATDGTATINLRNQGINVLMAIYSGPSDAPAKYDRIEHRASLSFVLPHAPE